MVAAPYLFPDEPTQQRVADLLGVDNLDVAIHERLDTLFDLLGLQYIVSAASDDLPSYGETEVGPMVFDTDLGYPVWWTGSGWVDATGADPYVT